MAIGNQVAGGRYFYYLRAAAVADLRSVDAFAGIGGYFPIGLTLALDGPPERIQGVRATAGLLTNLGVPFAAGRDLVRGEENVVVVTSGFAMARFGSEAAALDRAINVSAKAMRIVGVLAYRPQLPGMVSGAELYIPHANADAPVPHRRMTQAIVIARLKSGVARGAAEAQVRTVAADVQRRFGEEAMRLDLVPLRTAVSGSLRLPMLMLAAAAGVVFVIGISSLASLVLARAAARATDIAVRTSLGASRWRLVRAWLVDGSVLAIPGAALGLWVGLTLLRYLRTQLPPQLTMFPEASGTGPMIAAAAVLAVVSGLLFALAPIAAGLLKASSLSFLRATPQAATLRGVWSQSILIAGQVAVSVVLVASAIWLSTSLWRTLSRPIGFNPDNLVMMSVRTAQPVATQLQMARQVVTALQTLRAQSSEGAAATSALPALQQGSYAPSRIRPEHPFATESERPQVSISTVSTDFFRVIGVELVEGRTFVDADETTPEQVVIISRSFAQRFFPDGALGRFVAFSADDRREVIGIVEDVHAGRLTQDSVPQCYVPLSTAFGGPTNFVIRTSHPLDAIRTTAASTLREIDPNGQLVLFTASDAIALPLLLQILSNRLLLGFATLALVLAVVNVYALSAFAVVRRRREIGIRVALGATASEATRLVMRRGLTWTAAGLAVGTFTAIFLAAPVVQAQLYRTEARDPQLLALALGTVASVAVFASWIPARRAAAIDPAITLRTE